MSDEDISQKHIINCRAKEVASGNISECLEIPEKGCPHALPFGGGYFCLHPLRTEIVRKTCEIEGS